MSLWAYMYNEDHEHVISNVGPTKYIQKSNIKLEGAWSGGELSRDPILVCNLYM